MIASRVGGQEHGEERSMIDAELLLPISSSSLDARHSFATRDARVRAMVLDHFDVVWRSLRRLGVAPGTLDDAAQQVFIVASRRVEVIEEGRERPYLLGIALRVAADYRRARGRLREVAEADAGRSCDESAGPLPSTEDLLDQKRARETLDRVLSGMPDDLRTVFVLFELEGVVVPEIAAMLRIAQGTVASRIRRAREIFHKRVNALTVVRREGAR
jgi:RNA polymerase sigma-70 factor (ECF subfamily)